MSTPKFTSQSPQLPTFYEKMAAAFEAGDPNVHTKEAERKTFVLVLAMYKALIDGDIDGVLACFSDDIRMQIFVPAEFRFNCRANGIAQVRDLILGNFQLVQDQNPEILAVVAQGNLVMMTFRESGVLRATGVGYSIHAAQSLTIENGRISSFTQIAAKSA